MRAITELKTNLIEKSDDHQTTESTPYGSVTVNIPNEKRTNPFLTDRILPIQIGMICKFLSPKESLGLISSGLLEDSAITAFEQLLSGITQYQIFILLKKNYDKMPPSILVTPKAENFFRKLFFHAYLANPFYQLSQYVNDKKIEETIGKLICITNQDIDPLELARTQGFIKALENALGDPNELRFFPAFYPHSLFSNLHFRKSYNTLMLCLLSGLVATVALTPLIILWLSKEIEYKKLNELYKKCQETSMPIMKLWTTSNRPSYAPSYGNVHTHVIPCSYVIDTKMEIPQCFNPGGPKSNISFCNLTFPVLMNIINNEYCPIFYMDGASCTDLSPYFITDFINWAFGSCKHFLSTCKNLDLFNTTKTTYGTGEYWEYFDGNAQIGCHEDPCIAPPGNKYELPLKILSIMLPLVILLMLYNRYCATNKNSILVKYINFITCFFKRETIEKSKQLDLLDSDKKSIPESTMRQHSQLFKSFTTTIKERASKLENSQAYTKMSLNTENESV